MLTFIWGKFIFCVMFIYFLGLAEDVVGAVINAKFCYVLQ